MPSAASSALRWVQASSPRLQVRRSRATPQLVGGASGAGTAPSELQELLAGQAIEVLVLAAASAGSPEVEERLRAYVERIRDAGLEISGDGGEVLLKRKGEALDALQQIVNTGFRRELDDDRSFVVDCMGYRKGKDDELKQITRFTMEKAKM